MSTEARAGHFPAVDWEGGAFPYRVGHRKLGMWLFIVSDSLTLSALLIGYSYLRASNVWPTPFPFYPSIVFSSVMTFCLLSSSLTMVFGVSASSKGDKAKARKWISATIFFGVAFVILHLIEWQHLMHRGTATILPARESGCRRSRRLKACHRHRSLARPSSPLPDCTCSTSLRARFTWR